MGLFIISFNYLFLQTTVLFLIAATIGIGGVVIVGICAVVGGFGGELVGGLAGGKIGDEIADEINERI